MKQNKVIKKDNLPTRLPLFQTLTTWLALEHWHAPQWLYGALGLFFLLAWGFVIYLILNQEEVDILNKEN